MNGKYQIGDTVSVRAKVVSQGDVMVLCSFYAPNASHNNITFSVDVKDIVTHTPRPIKVGDVVKDTRLVCDHTYTIMAIHKEYAWVKPAINDKCFTVLLDKLERV